MIKITELLATHIRLQQEDAPRPKQEKVVDAPKQYARAPDATGPQRTGSRPPAIQRNRR